MTVFYVAIQTQKAIQTGFILKYKITDKLAPLRLISVIWQNAEISTQREWSHMSK